MVPDFGGLIWLVITLLSNIAWVTLAILFIFWFMPSIARTFISAKWRGGVVAFIQDDTGKVHLCVSDKEYPEGVVHFKGRGWFMLPIRPVDQIRENPSLEDPEKLRFREAFIRVKMEDGKTTREEALEEFVKLGFTTELTADIQEKMEKAKAEAEKVIEKLIHTPILAGLGKQVFFGSSDSVALSNLKTIGEVTNKTEVVGTERNVNTGIIEKVKLLAHANLKNCRLLAPLMYSKTQLDALATGNRIEGMKMFGRDTMKLIFVIVCIIGLVATVGIIAWLLTQG